MHGHQAIVFLQLHISTVDREVHHSKHKTTPFLFEAGRPGGRVRAHTPAYANFDRVLVVLARAHVNMHVHGLVYIHTVNVHVYVCAQLQSNLVNMNSTGPSKKVYIKRNFTLTVARCMGVILPGDFKVVHIKRYFALNVFVLTRFHCT